MKPLHLIILFTLFFSVLKASAQPDTISFLHISDLHIISNLDNYHNGIAGRRLHYSNGADTLKIFMKEIKKNSLCDFITATGDLVDFYQAESNENIIAGVQTENFLRLIKKSSIPFYLTLGNHDISYYNWNDSTLVSNQYHAEEARAGWIKKSECFNKGTYYSLDYLIDHSKYRLIFLDNSFYKMNEGETIVLPYINREQIHWLEYQLTESEDDTEIIFMHLPFTYTDTPENNSLFSVVSRNPSVKLILAGHNHRNTIQQFKTPDGQLTQVQTGGFGQSIKNWRQISMTKNNILISYPGKTEVELEIPVK